MALDLNELQKVIDDAKTAGALKVELRNTFRKHASAVDSFTKTINEFNDQIQAMLKDDYTPSPLVKKERKPRALKGRGDNDAAAPYGRKKDGTPKSKPGRGAEVTGELGQTDAANVKDGGKNTGK